MEKRKVKNLGATNKCTIAGPRRNWNAENLKKAEIEMEIKILNKRE
jgi:hypothetical protein